MLGAEIKRCPTPEICLEYASLLAKMGKREQFVRVMEEYGKLFQQTGWAVCGIPVGALLGAEARRRPCARVDPQMPEERRASPREALRQIAQKLKNRGEVSPGYEDSRNGDR